MDKTVAAIRDELADREAIRDCMMRYCRAIDRRDRELLRTVYWSDATDEHLGFFGGVDEFIDYCMSAMATMEQTAHLLGNILIEIEGGSANVESYFQAFHRIREPEGQPHDFVLGGRYVDRFECRAELWRVASRVVIADWFRDFPDSGNWSHPMTAGWGKPGGFKPHDRSYNLFNRPFGLNEGTGRSCIIDQESADP